MSGVRLILYLAKHSQPKLSNTVTELSKCMDEVNMSPCKTLLCARKYVIDKKYYFY